MTSHPLTSRDPKSANMLMREIRRELGVAGATIHNADQYTVYLGKGAYSTVCMWLQDADNPTAQRVKIKYSPALRGWAIDVTQHTSIGAR